MFSLMKYTAIILKKYTISNYLKYTSIHLGKLHRVYFKYYIFRTIKYTLSNCLSFFLSVYLKYTPVHANANKTAVYFKYTSLNMQFEPDMEVYSKYTPSTLEVYSEYSSMCNFALHVDMQLQWQCVEYKCST